MIFEKQLQEDQALIEHYLADYLDTLWPYGKLVDAMSYSLLGGGKRIRPVLTLEACRFCGGDVEKALPFACALEMVHTYSLIHDDLPCMDDDDFRRGRPTNHRVFGQANAVLAGDALLTAAFELLSKAPHFSAEQRLAAVRVLSEAAGPSGMVAGQVLDMEGSVQIKELSQIRAIESLKTGKLIVAAVQLGCIAAKGDEEVMQALSTYAEKIGLAFQIQDDILDCEGDEEELGKPIGSDKANGKVTFVTLTDIETCREMVRSLTGEAQAALGNPESNGFLQWLSQKLSERRA